MKDRKKKQGTRRAERPFVDAYMKPAQRRAFHAAREMLPDFVSGELRLRSKRPSGVSDADWRADPEGALTGYCLPPHYLARYTLAFCTRFLDALNRTAAKLGATESAWEPLNSVAEEMSAFGIMLVADGIWEKSNTPFHEAWGDVIEEVFEDIDFRHLWNPALDGIQDSPLGRRGGIIHLDFDEWFLPFRDDDSSVSEE